MDKNSTTEMSNIEMYGGAVEAIKDAILQGQYEAAKSVNRIQLAVYFAIGKYISQHTRKNVWGTHALEFISDRLRKELPGLRGFGETQMKDMRRFYEAWQILDANSAVATAELQEPENEIVNNSAVITAELATVIKGSSEGHHGQVPRPSKLTIKCRQHKNKDKC